MEFTVGWKLLNSYLTRKYVSTIAVGKRELVVVFYKSAGFSNGLCAVMDENGGQRGMGCNCICNQDFI